VGGSGGGALGGAGSVLGGVGIHGKNEFGSNPVCLSLVLRTHPLSLSALPCVCLLLSVIPLL